MRARIARGRERQWETGDQPGQLAAAEQDHFAAETDAKKAQTEGVRLDNELRRDVARFIGFVAAGTMAAMLLLVAFQGFGCWGFKLPDSVLLSVIGGTLGEVLALAAIVVKYLFPNQR